MSSSWSGSIYSISSPVAALTLIFTKRTRTKITFSFRLSRSGNRGRVHAHVRRDTQYITMLGQHRKLDVDLLSYFLDAKLKHSSKMKLKTKCLQLCYMAFKI